jgi:hypothetical protein
MLLFAHAKCQIGKCGAAILWLPRRPENIGGNRPASIIPRKKTIVCFAFSGISASVIPAFIEGL